MSWDPVVALIVAAVGCAVLGLIYVFGQPKRPPQGLRTAAGSAGEGAGRREPSLGGNEASDPDAAIELELARLEATLSGDPAPSPRAETAVSAAAPRSTSSVGERQTQDFDKIVSLFVQCQDGHLIGGAELVVAAEKAGLSYGAMNIFHRLVDGRPEQGPIFSVANMVKPGSFDLRDLESLKTPGLSFFMTLPGPLSGLDAWDTMLPAAQRMAELLNAQVLDDRRNTLGRQRIAHLRDELRAYDRKHEVQGLSGW